MSGNGIYHGICQAFPAELRVWENNLERPKSREVLRPGKGLMIADNPTFDSGTYVLIAVPQTPERIETLKSW